MILYIRNKKNETIVDVELSIVPPEEKFNYPAYIELSSSVMVSPYSKLLLSLTEEDRQQAIDIFDNIQELRGWLWESYFMGRKNDPEEYKTVLEELRGVLKGVCKKYNLCYVED